MASIVVGIGSSLAIYMSGQYTINIAIVDIILPNLEKNRINEIVRIVNNFFFYPRTVFLVVFQVIYGFIFLKIMKGKKDA